MAPHFFRRLRALVALICALVAVESAHASDAGWTDLLADDALSKTWRGYKQDESPRSWTLADGVLSCDGSGGDLITRETYSDFDLRFDFKITPGGNSGVLYRVTEAADQPYESGPEFQVLDPDHPNVSPEHGPAALYALYPAPPAASKPAGEWNTGRIVVASGAVEHWINGQKVVSAQIGSDDWNRRVAGSKFATWEHFAKSASGHISLQEHGSEVAYRNVRIKPLVGAADTGQGTRVLFVTQSAGFVHSTVDRKANDMSFAERVLKEMGVRTGRFRVDCTQDVATDFKPELIKNYDVVAFYTTGELPIPVETREWFLNDWLAEEGHGFLGIHCAADTYAGYEPYWDMIGGTFDGHPWTSNHEVVVQVHADDHPASKPWGAAGTRIRLLEEIYQFKNWQPEKVRVLMSLDMEQTELKQPRHIPVLWVKQYGAGRVMHMSMGHREDVWTNPTYQESIVAGIGWLTGAEQGDATPNPELSAVEQEKAEKAFEASR